MKKKEEKSIDFANENKRLKRELDLTKKLVEKLTKILSKKEEEISTQSDEIQDLRYFLSEMLDKIEDITYLMTDLECLTADAGEYIGKNKGVVE